MPIARLQRAGVANESPEGLLKQYAFVARREAVGRRAAGAYFSRIVTALIPGAPYTCV